MSQSLQEFLTTAIPKAANDLVTALHSLPEDKRNWSPMGAARTALDMVAECATMNDISVFVETRAFPADFDYPAIVRSRAELAKDPVALIALLHESAARAVATIQTVPAEDLNIEVPMPWGMFTLAQIMAYPYWNMSYHEGQINYIASMLTHHE